MNEASPAASDARFAELAALLRRRVDLIADHAWRDRDAASHLAALRDVSLEIDRWTVTHGPLADARLRHYLQQSSYAKALAHLESPQPPPHVP